MSQERVLETLMGFGLTRIDAKIYILLAKRGPQKASDVGKALKVSRQPLYRSLKNLEGRGVVSATLEHPAKFSALPFEKALDLLAKAKMKKALEEAQRIQETTDDLLANWKALSVSDYEDTSAKFMVIEGRNNIYARIQQMITETRSQISTMTTVPSLIRADQFGLFDIGSQHPLKSQIKFRFLTELAESNVPAMKALLKEIAEANLNFEGRNPDLGLMLFPRMVIRDEDEILFFIKSSPDASATEQDTSSMWTNCKDLVQAFSGIFEQLWHNSTNIKEKIEEIEKAKLIVNVETARAQYAETLRLAKSEVFVMTSSEGLTSLWKKIEPLQERLKKGVSVRIMAPITSENLPALRELSDFCEVRHIPRSALGTTIIDGKHLFQFTNLTDRENAETVAYSENIYYAVDKEYVGRMRGMLENIWRNASAPSAVTLESILTPLKVTTAASTSDRADAELLKKDQVRLSESGWRANVTMGMAVIHPPKHLKLFDMMVHVQKSTKESEFGASDTVIFYLCMGSAQSDPSHHWPGGFSTYVPLAIVNNNPRSSIMLKTLYGRAPAAQNIIEAKPQQLEVWQQGNTLFAGWTIPIPLPSPRYSLPPSCILFEGIGEAHHKKTAFSWSSGHRLISEYDEREAFVTFITPSSKYSGPGTDGFLRTNYVAMTTPPQQTTDKS